MGVTGFLDKPPSGIIEESHLTKKGQSAIGVGAVGRKNYVLWCVGGKGVLTLIAMVSFGHMYKIRLGRSGENPSIYFFGRAAAIQLVARRGKCPEKEHP